MLYVGGRSFIYSTKALEILYIINVIILLSALFEKSVFHAHDYIFL